MPDRRVVALALQVEVFADPHRVWPSPTGTEDAQWADTIALEHQREQLRVIEHWTREARTVVVSVDDLAIDVALMAEQLANQIRDQLAQRYGDTRHSGGQTSA